MRMDPVCYDDVDEEEALRQGLVCQVGQRVYFFCSHGCRRRFVEAPSLYLDAALSESAGEAFLGASGN